MVARPGDDADAPARCDRAARQRIVLDARALGVPPGYGASRQLRLVREPRALACIGEDIHGRRQWLAPRAARAFLRLQAAAASDGVTVQVVSAFRSAEYQLGILRRKLERGQAMQQILEVSAAPGYSEHHSGRALDVTTPGCRALDEEFERSPAFAWLDANAGRFGFALSYPRGNRHGIAYEAWHWGWRAR